MIGRPPTTISTPAAPRTVMGRSAAPLAATAEGDHVGRYCFEDPAFAAITGPEIDGSHIGHLYLVGQVFLSRIIGILWNGDIAAPGWRGGRFRRIWGIRYLN